MAINAFAQVIPTAMWPQGDIRDPLGVWGFREGVTGDASGNGIDVIAQVPAGLAAAYIYTCYTLTLAQLSGALAGNAVMSRLLTNWPDIDPASGVTGYGSALVLEQAGSGGFENAPVAGVNGPLVNPNDRFLLLFDPRPSAGALDIVEMRLSANVDLATYSFEGYGYFWDRSVLNAPGGPRHPGSS